MMKNTTEELIKRAAAVVNARKIGDRLIGDVGCALITDQGNVYVGGMPRYRIWYRFLRRGQRHSSYGNC